MRFSCPGHTRFTHHNLAFTADTQNRVNPAVPKNNRPEPSPPSPPRYIPGFLPLALVFALLFTAFEISANTSAAKSETTKKLEFDVYLENRPIGSHEFVFSDDGEKTEVSINASFKVKVLFVTAFNYQHTNTEMWLGNCLHSINATTVVNGDTYEVSGKQADTSFRVIEATNDKPPATKTLKALPREARTACTRSFAYWDRSLLPSSGLPTDLLNAQTGELVPATLTPLAKGMLAIGEQQLPVNRYLLQGKDLQVTLAYNQGVDGNEEWVGLSSKVRGGRTLTYIRTPGSLNNP